MSTSRWRVHELVVMMALADDEDSTLADTGVGRASGPGGPSPSGMWTSTTSASRRVSGTRTFGAVGGDQPVDQHDGAVRYPADHAGASVLRRRVGPGPRSRHSVLAHAPAARSEPSADPAVVGVATAGPRRVIDAVRYDDVDLDPRLLTAAVRNSPRRHATHAT